MPRKRVPDDLQSLLPLTPAVFFVLFALSGGERHGYAIMREVAELSDGTFRMGPGTLYLTIQRLLDLEAIEETGLDSEPEGRRRTYRLTRSGKALVAAEIRRMDALLLRAQQKKLLPRRST
jgi:DNA-binding PadR family transcriptional regulator